MNNSHDITAYNQSQTGPAAELCAMLEHEIRSRLPGAQARLYHGSPVWFIDDNPIVGYDVSAKGTNLLFWSGQSFAHPGLQAKGKFKAAGITYQTPADVDVAALHQWLAESKTVQWDYKFIRQNNGELHRL